MKRSPLSFFSRAIGKAIREPLLQFLAAAIVLFTANTLIHGADRRPPGEAITIPEGQVAQIAESYRLLAGRMPSRAELAALVEDYIDEEVDYREAVAMGLDANDTIVRRRMRQKLEFLVEDAEASEAPTEAELKTYLDAHADTYRLAGRLAIRQVLASRDAHGAKAKAGAEEMLKKLKAGADPTSLGDASMLPAAMPLTTEQGVAALFGEDFASTVFKHGGKGWFGPVSSPFGEHLVLVMDSEAGRAALLEDVREKVKSDWIEQKRADKRDEFQARLRKRYEVKVDWPKEYAGATLDDAKSVPRKPANDPSGAMTTLSPGKLPEE